MTVTGNAYIASVIETSDINLKTNISYIEQPLAKLSSIKGVYFKWKQNESINMQYDDDKHIGVIAQVKLLIVAYVKIHMNGSP